jgi:hypothetical protein
MADPALVISLAAEFVGKPAFKQADTATEKLSKGVKNLAKSLGAAFSVSAVVAYGKAAIKAAAADEKAQKQLALALKNVGLGRDAAASEGYIQKLQKEFGVLDDNLRPAYQTLAVATRDTAQAQKLLQLALDISASTGKDLASTSSALSKAFLGNNAALSKLGVGISKADLKTKSFEQITAELSKTFAGSATASANTFQGSMDKLTVASANAQEIIGQGLINALKGLGDDKSIDGLASDMENLATKISGAIQGIGLMLEALQKIPSIPGLGAITQLDKFFQFTNIGLALKLFEAANRGSANNPAEGLAHLAELEARYTAATLKSSKKLTAEEAKQLKDKKLKLAIDKANLALGKGSDVFDVEKISLAAAEKNAAEQLGKVTSQAQLLQITNDLARLEVKKSILALEDAIKTNDIAAITNATAKLNADLAVLGALTGQKVKLTEIKDILAGIVPKDLINLGNLDAAIARLLMIASFGDGSGMKSHAAPILGDPNASPKGFPGAAGINAALAAGSFVPIVPGTGGVYGGSSRAGNYAPSGFPGAGGVTVIVNAGTIAAPDDLVVLIKTAIQDLNRAGDSTTFAGAIA